MAVWEALTAIGTFSAAGVAAAAAIQSKLAADKANQAAGAMLQLETERRRDELQPLFDVICEPDPPGTENLRLRIRLAAPSGLPQVDSLTITVRDDFYRRGEAPALAAGPTPEQITNQIWGPYRFRPATGPYQARADEFGRQTVYEHSLPMGEELPFLLEPTMPPSWSQMTHDDWVRFLLEGGKVIRLQIVARYDKFAWQLVGDVAVPIFSNQNPTVLATIPPRRRQGPGRFGSLPG